MTTPNTWSKYLPAIYADEPFLNDFLSIFESIWIPLEAQIDQLQHQLGQQTEAQNDFQTQRDELRIQLTKSVKRITTCVSEKSLMLVKSPRMKAATTTTMVESRSSALVGQVAF